MAVVEEKPHIEAVVAMSAAEQKQMAASECSDGYPRGVSLALIIISLSISVFLCALDETIIVTAIPKITDDFHSLQDVGWYGSAYFMTFATSQLPLGRIYTLYPIKPVFLFSILLFETGSLLCGAASSSTLFITGRALAGLGSGGINAGFIIILAASLPLPRRPVFVPCYSAMYGLAAVVAPLLGGAFSGSEEITWRWCFYLNLPVGGIAALIMIFFCHFPSDKEKEIPGLSWRLQDWKMLAGEMDLLGTAILIPSLVGLLLALQWGGAGQHDWNSALMIALFTISGVGLAVFITLQIYKGDKATIPKRIITQRSVACSAAFVFFGSGTVTLFQYYLPIWFQAIQNATPLESGIRILPTTLTISIFSFLSGIAVAKTGYYTPFMILGAGMLSGGAFFAATALSVSSSTGIWIGCQLLFGVGAGIGLQQAHTAAQTVLSSADVPIGAVILIFAHVMGGVVFIPVAQSIFTGVLLSGVREVLGSHGHEAGDLGVSSARQILDLGANGFRTLAGISENPDVLGRVLEVYNSALKMVFLAGGCVAAAAFLASLGMEWISIKKDKIISVETDAQA